VSRIAGWALVAVAARLAVAWASQSSGVFADMAQYHERAIHLATTGTLFPDALRGPGYPAFLAAVYAVTGVSFTAARVAQALVGGALALLTGWVAARAGAGERAWVASAIVALYPGLVLSSVYLMPEGLYTLLAMITLVLVRHRSSAMGAAAGAAAGLAILTRSVGLTLVVAAGVLAVSTWWMPRRGGASSGMPVEPTLPPAWRFGAFLGAVLVVLAPWLAFTTRVAGGPLLDTTSGMNVLLGSHDGATGRLQMADDAPLRARFVAGAASEADANARALRAGMSWAAAHPAAWLRLAGAKLGYLFGLEGREHAWVYSVGYFGARQPATVAVWGMLLLAAFPILVVAAVVGTVRAAAPPPAVVPPSRPQDVVLRFGAAGAARGGDAEHGLESQRRTRVALAAFVLATAALHVTSFGESRFHLPLVPVLAVAASLGTAPLARASRARLLTAGVAVAVLAFAWASQAPELLDALSALRAPNGAATPRPY